MSLLPCVRYDWYAALACLSRAGAWEQFDVALSWARHRGRSFTTTKQTLQGERSPNMCWRRQACGYQQVHELAPMHVPGLSVHVRVVLLFQHCVPPNMGQEL